MVIVALVLLPSVVSNSLCIFNVCLVLVSFGVILGQRLYWLLGIAITIAIYHFVVADYASMGILPLIFASMSPWGMRQVYLSLYTFSSFFVGAPRRAFLALLEVFDRVYPMIATAQKKARELSYGNKFDHALASLKGLIRIHEINLKSKGPDTFSRPVFQKRFIVEIAISNIMGFVSCVFILLRFFKII